MRAKPSRRREAGSGLSRRVGSAALGLLAWAVGIIFIMPIFWMVLTGLHRQAELATQPAKTLRTSHLGLVHRIFRRDLRGEPDAVSCQLGGRVDRFGHPCPAVGDTGCLRSICPPGRKMVGRAFLLSRHKDASNCRGAHAHLSHREQAFNAEQYLVSHDHLRGNKSTDRDLDDQGLHERHSEGAVRGCRPRWGGSCTDLLVGHRASACARHRRHESLICFIFSWNELLFASALSGANSATAPVYLLSFVTSVGSFLPQLCSAATIVSIPVLAAGFAAQDRLVQGLSLGAIK